MFHLEDTNFPLGILRFDHEDSFRRVTSFLILSRITFIGTRSLEIEALGTALEGLKVDVLEDEAIFDLIIFQKQYRDKIRTELF